MPNALKAAIVIAVLVLVIVGAVSISSRDTAAEPRRSEPPAHPMPPLGTIPRQRLDTEWLPMSPDTRAAIVDQLYALWDASPDDDVQTDLRADPNHHKPS